LFQAIVTASWTSVQTKFIRKGNNVTLFHIAKVSQTFSDLPSKQRNDKLFVETFDISTIILEKAPTFSLPHQKRWIYSLYKSVCLQTQT